MSGIETVVVPVTTTGSAASATGSATSAAIVGFLLDVYLDYHASAPATTDVTIAYDEPDSGNVLAVSNANTDGLFAPRQTVHTTAGALTDPDGYDRLPLNGALTVSVAGADALDPCVTARIRYLRL